MDAAGRTDSEDAGRERACALGIAFEFVLVVPPVVISEIISCQDEKGVRYARD